MNCPSTIEMKIEIAAKIKVDITFVPAPPPTILLNTSVGREVPKPNPA